MFKNSRMRSFLGLSIFPTDAALVLFSPRTSVIGHLGSPRTSGFIFQLFNSLDPEAWNGIVFLREAFGSHLRFVLRSGSDLSNTVLGDDGLYAATPYLTRSTRLALRPWTLPSAVWLGGIVPTRGNDAEKEPMGRK